MLYISYWDMKKYRCSIFGIWRYVFHLKIMNKKFHILIYVQALHASHHIPFQLHSPFYFKFLFYKYMVLFSILWIPCSNNFNFVDIYFSLLCFISQCRVGYSLFCFVLELFVVVQYPTIVTNLLFFAPLYLSM